LRSQNIM